MTERTLAKFDKYLACPNDGKILKYYAGIFDTVFVAFHQFYNKKADAVNLPFDQRILDKNTFISWDEILQLTGISSLADLDVGLRTLIGGLGEQYENRYTAKVIEELNDGIGIPIEGFICPFVEKKLLNALLLTGDHQLWVNDEVGTERKLWKIEDLLSNDAIPYAACNFTPDKSIAITTHWDSHCTFICGNGDKIRKIIIDANLEGFYCDENTEVYWSLT